jgi:integrase
MFCAPSSTCNADHHRCGADRPTLKVGLGAATDPTVSHLSSDCETRLDFAVYGGASSRRAHTAAVAGRRPRWIPLSQSARRELRRYLDVRRKLRHGTSSSAPLLFNGRRAAVCYTGTGISRGITQLFIAANLHDTDGRPPRIHDLRHSFAVGALLRWYQCGADVQSSLPKLALYMGHVSIASTAYYLRFMPAVVAQASERFARSCAGVVEGDAS